MCITVSLCCVPRTNKTVSQLSSNTNFKKLKKLNQKGALHSDEGIARPRRCGEQVPDNTAWRVLKGITELQGLLTINTDHLKTSSRQIKVPRRWKIKLRVNRTNCGKDSVTIACCDQLNSELYGIKGLSHLNETQLALECSHTRLNTTQKIHTHIQKQNDKFKWKISVFQKDATDRRKAYAVFKPDRLSWKNLQINNSKN